MSESIGDDPNRRLSYAGVAAGDFARDTRPSAPRGQAVRVGDRAALRDPRHGRRCQLLSVDARVHPRASATAQ
jgi:hypothetical protein